MSLAIDDEVTLVEIGVILVGIAVAWAVYRLPSSESNHRGESHHPRSPGHTPQVAPGDRGRAP
jgi:hypothetical protein